MDTIPRAFQIALANYKLKAGCAVCGKKQQPNDLVFKVVHPEDMRGSPRLDLVCPACREERPAR